MSAVAELEHVPMAPHAAADASKVTFVVCSALEIMPAAVLSTMIAKGSVSQVPALPFGAVVSTTKPLP